MYELGIDIHPVYQEHIDWKNLDPTVKYVWLKVSDGGSKYVKIMNGKRYTSDAHAQGMKSVKGLACGGYHFAELSPSPESQAEVLAAEVRRLGLTSLPPALDIEAPFSPGPTAADFSRRFLEHLKTLGFARVAIYGYTTMLRYLNPESWKIPGLIIWVARPAPVGELGVYKGRTDVHQYTDAGNIRGIVESVDCNSALTNNLLLTQKEEGMNWEQDRRAYNLDRFLTATFRGETTVTEIQPFWPGWATNTGTPPAKVSMANPFLASVAKIDGLASGASSVDLENLADLVVERLLSRLNLKQAQ